MLLSFFIVPAFSHSGHMEELCSWPTCGWLEESMKVSLPLAWRPILEEKGHLCHPESLNV